jgi:hypothetical protein
MKINNTKELTIIFKKNITSNWNPTSCIEDYIMENYGGGSFKSTKTLWCVEKKLIFGLKKAAHSLPTSKSTISVHSSEPYKNWRKLHLGLIHSRNWVCLVLPESLGKIQFMCAKSKFKNQSSSYKLPK